MISPTEARQRLAAVLHETAGLVVPTSRGSAVAAALAERLAARPGLDSAGYLAEVEDPSTGAEERQELVELLTVPETFFFRTAPHVAALREVVLPALVAGAAREGRPLVVWSAGCSSGEEAYTLSVLLQEAVAAQRAEVGLRVLGTDVSRRALARAARARYGPRSLQVVPDDVLASCFERVGAQWTPVERVRRPVSFLHHNLVAQPPPALPGTVDLVLCRNVTIYFDRATTAALAARFAEVLRPDGRLLLGPAETLWRLSDALVPVPVADAMLYARPRGTTPHGRSSTWTSTSPPPPRAASASAAPTRAGSATARRAARAGRRGAPTAAPALPAAPAVPPASAVPAASGVPGSSAAPGTHLPQDAPALLAAGVAHLRAGRRDAARDAAAAVAERAPLLASAHFLHGLALSDGGDDAAARDALRRAVYLDPDDGLAHLVLAGVHSRLGARAAASREYRAAAAALRRRPPVDVAGVLDGQDADVDALVRTCEGLGGASPAVGTGSA